MASLEALEEAVTGLRDEFRHFRDTEFANSCGRNDKDHEEILGEVKRINSDVGLLKLWKAKLEGAAVGVGLSGKIVWAFIGVLVSVSCVVLGAALARGVW